MSALKFSGSRKRHHFPEFRDSEDSDSEDLPARKKRKNEDFPVIFREKLQRISNWFWEIKTINKFARMALRSAALPPHKQEFKNNSDFENNSDFDDTSDEDDVDIEIEDDDIQEIKEIVNKETLSPVIKQFEKSIFSDDSGRSKQHLTINGSYSLGSCYNSSKVNGAKPRELSTRRHGTTHCNLRREQTEKLKRKPLISNPASEIEIIVGAEPEIITLEGDGIEILSESATSKQNNTSSQKIFRSSVKSASPKNTVLAIKQTLETPMKKLSSTPRSYTANEVVRLQEKAQYKLLLEKYITGPPYQYVCKKREPEESIKEDPRVFSNSHFKKEILEQPVANFIEKYYTPCRLLSPKEKEPQEKKKEPPETVTLDDDNDEVKIVKMKRPQYKAVFKSQVCSKDWLAELSKHVQAQSEERNRIVQEYEQRLESLKKDRLIKEIRPDVPSKPAEPEFPELTPEMESAIDDVLIAGSANDLICKTVSGTALIRKDFETLQGLHWLNDTIINGYFELIVERSKKEGYPSAYAFNTFFYGNLKGKGYSAVRRWTRKIDLFSYDLNFVPLHVTFHWCLAVIDHRSKKISYYDSMGNGEEESLNVLHEYLCLEYKDKKGEVLDPSIYVTEAMKDIPQQMNGSDCGMFTLKYAEYISRNAEITFDQQHMNYFRRRTVYELFTNQLL